MLGEGVFERTVVDAEALPAAGVVEGKRVAEIPVPSATVIVSACTSNPTYVQLVVWFDMTDSLRM